MKIRWSIYFVLLLSAVLPLQALGIVVHYKGIAKKGDRTAYIEHHTVEYSESGKLLKATTNMYRPRESR